MKPHRETSISEVELVHHWTEDEIPRQNEIHRVQAEVTTNAIILSHLPLIAKLHFYGGFTVPHTHPQCDACEKGTELRVRFYFIVQHLKTKVIDVMELTKPHLAQAEEYERVHKTLRGCNIRAMRTNGEKNGKIRSTWVASNLPELSMPQAFDLAKWLHRLWKLTGEDTYRRDPHETPDAIQQRLNNLASSERTMVQPSTNGHADH